MAKKASGKQRPNIVIFMMDTQGARNMSCYGYRLKTTPNIDEIGREGVVFLNHFVTGPWTLPSHASLFTGRYLSGHGACAQHEVLEPGLPNMGEVFGRAGYRSVALCNNGWAYDPGPNGTSRGMDEHIKYNAAEHKAVAPYIPSDNPDERDKGSLKAVGVACKWIDGHRKKNASQPFLMFINCTEPHDPYRPPEPWRSRFLPEGVNYAAAAHAPHGWQCLATTGDVCPTLDQWFIQRALYDASTACLDDRIGKLTAELRKREIYDDTIFIVVGDHGDVQGEQIHYAYHSQNGVWDRTCKTPLVVRYPKVFKPKTRCKELVQINDVLPTLMEICGIKDAEAGASIQGESLVKAVKGPVREFALIEAQRAIHPMRRGWVESLNSEDLDVRFANVWHKAARAKRYKYVWVSNGQDMLFDTVKDPDERWNILTQKPEIAKKLMKAMEKKLMSMEQRYYMDLFKPANNPRLNPYQKRRLAAWGLYQPGIVAPWDPKELAEYQKRMGEKPIIT